MQLYLENTLDEHSDDPGWHPPWHTCQGWWRGTRGCSKGHPPNPGHQWLLWWCLVVELLHSLHLGLADRIKYVAYWTEVRYHTILINLTTYLPVDLSHRTGRKSSLISGSTPRIIYVLSDCVQYWPLKNIETQIEQWALRIFLRSLVIWLEFLRWWCKWLKRLLLSKLQ